MDVAAYKANETLVFPGLRIRPGGVIMSSAPVLSRTTLIRVRETGLALQTLPGPRPDTRGKAS